MNKKNLKFFVILITAIAAVLLDQLSKYIVKTNMQLFDSIALIKNIFHITYVVNTGSAFGMLKGWNSVLIFLSIAAIGYIFFKIDEIKDKDKKLQILAGVILGGIIGNLIDRLAYGHVIDFIDIGYKPVYTWPVFNIADSFLSVGIILLMIYFWKK